MGHVKYVKYWPDTFRSGQAPGACHRGHIPSNPYDSRPYNKHRPDDNHCPVSPTLIRVIID